MSRKILFAMMIILPVTVLLVIGISAYRLYERDYCTDVPPDTPNIYVYAADLAYTDLNTTYCTGKGITPTGDSFRMIRYEDIPEIASLDGVTGLYIFSDVKLDAFFARGNTGDTLEMSVPHDIITHFGDPSSMSAMFVLTIGGAPADGSKGICLPQDIATGLGMATVGSTVTWNGKEYTLTGINKYDFAWVPFEEDKSLFYVYNPSTWEEFMSELNDYMIEEDTVSYVSMMICCEEGKSAELQDYLITNYPASNYTSREFVKVWKSQHNKGYWKSLGIIAFCSLAVGVPAEFFMITVYRKKK